MMALTHSDFHVSIFNLWFRFWKYDIHAHIDFFEKELVNLRIKMSY